MQKWWAYFFGVVLAAAFGLVVVSPLLGWWLPSNVCVFGKDVDLLFYAILAVTGFFFVVTEGILVYAMFRFAAQPGRRAQYTHGNHKLELVWTLIPAVILLLIAFSQVSAWERIKYQSRMPIPDQIVQVTARQFEWRIRYPTMPTLEGMVGKPDPAKGDRTVQDWKQSGEAEKWAKDAHFDDLHVVNEIHTWKGAHVRVYLKTRDVIHSFFLPNMRIKQDALPGKTIPVWFQPEEANTHWNEKEQKWVVDEDKHWELACAELCGWGHSKMRGKLYVYESREMYEQWLKQAQEKQNSHKP